MTEYVTTGMTNQEGKFYLYNRVMMDRYFKNNPQKSFELVIREVNHEVNSSYRRYYFMVVVKAYQILLRDAGYSFNRDETHEYIKQFSPIMEKVVWRNGHPVRQYKSLKEITQKQFDAYVEDLKRFAAMEFGYYIEDLIPN